MVGCNFFNKRWQVICGCACWMTPKRANQLSKSQAWLVEWSFFLFCHPVCRTLYHVTVGWNAILHIASHSCLSSRYEIRSSSERSILFWERGGGEVWQFSGASNFFSLSGCAWLFFGGNSSCKLDAGFFLRDPLHDFFSAVFAVQENFRETAQPLPPQNIIVRPLMD